MSRMRVPEGIQRLVAEWPGNGTAANLLPDGTLQVRHYEAGAALAEYQRGGPRDYCLWDITQGSMLASWTTARDMWEHARTVLERGPDEFGLVQLSPCSGSEDW